MPAPDRARPRSALGSSAIGLALGLALALGCRPRAETAAPAAAGEAPPLPAVDHGDPPPYAGTWVGPELTLSFVGPWVLVRPTASPSLPPIELRASVERREGDAFALRTSVAGALPADFLRPTDWTMLVEDGQLAIAMGDEPLVAYARREDPEPILVGPTMLGEVELPNDVIMAEAVACLELAGDRCSEIEAAGPLAAGCRELEWAACIEATSRPSAADPTVRAAIAIAWTIRLHTLALRYAGALLDAAGPGQRAAAQALHQRTRERAREDLDALRSDGPLPSDDPHLPELLIRLTP